MAKKAAGGAGRLVQAAARPTTSLSVIESQLSETAIETFAKAFGGREALGELFAIAGAGTEAEALALLLLDPRYTGLGLGKLCTMANVTVADFFAAAGKATFVKAQLHAQHRIATHLVDVVEDVMTRAKPIEIPCDGCKGMGTVSPPGKPDDPPMPCGMCRGTGRTLTLPELDRQKVALDLGRMLQKGPSGPLVAVQQNFGAGGEGGSGRRGPVIRGGLEQLQQAVNDALFARPGLPAPRAVVDAEVVEATE